MLQLIYGLSGTGKTYEIIDQIQKDVSNGVDSVFLIVPEQLVLSTERKMLSILPPAAQLNFHVLSFSRLANLVFRKYGGLSYNYITPGIETLIMWSAIRESVAFFKEYSLSSANDDTLPSLMLTAIREFRAYGVSPEKLDDIISTLDDTHPSKNKLSDISLIYSLYDALVKEHFDDAAEDLDKLYKLLSEKDFFAGAHVYFDAFIGYTAQEFSILERIIEQANKVTVSLCLDKPHTSKPHFYTSNDTASRLRRIARESLRENNLKEIIFKDIRRTESCELKILNKGIWSYDISEDNRELLPAEKTGCVEVYSCMNPYSEAEMIANYICKYVSNGYRYKDIAVVFRNASSRLGILDNVLEKCGIPFFMSQKSDVVTKPIIKLLIAALRISINNYALNDVISFIKTGLAGIDPNEADIFEEYCTTWNIRGKRFDREFTMNPNGYTKKLDERADMILKTAEKVRTHFMSILSPFCERVSKSKTAKEFCLALYELTVSLNASEELISLSKKEAELGFIRESDETLQLYNLIIRSLSDITNVIGGTEMSAKEFLTALKLVLSDTDIGTIPTSADQVTVGSANILRLNDIKIAFVCGLCEGEFPMKVSDSAILSDEDKKIFLENGLELSSDKSVEASDELFFVYNALSVPSEKLILSAPETTSGKANHPSAVFERIKLLLPHIKISSYDSLPPDKRFYAPRSAFEYLTTAREGVYSDALRQTFEGMSEFSDLLPTIGKSVTDDMVSVHPDTAGMVFGKTMRLSQSQIEKYIGCRMLYYCEYVLNLRARRTIKYQSNDMGTFIHYVLENAMKYIRDSYSIKCGEFPDDNEVGNIVNMIVPSFIASNYPDDVVNTGRMKHLIEKMQRLAGIVIQGLISEFKDSDFFPAHFEFDISGKRGTSPYMLTLKDGRTVHLTGYADRIDLYSDGNNVYVRVVDYKTGNKTFSLSDIETGHNLQTFLYLFALCSSADKVWLKDFCDLEDPQVMEASAIYMSSNIKPLNPEFILKEEEILNLALDGIVRKGVSTNKIEVLRAISNSLSKKIIPGGVSEGKNKSKNKLLLSDEAFKQLNESIDETIKLIATDMLSGNASARPYCMGKSEAPDLEDNCMYCEMRYICRLPGIKTPKVNI